jgi:hypothetical protein
MAEEVGNNNFPFSLHAQKRRRAAAKPAANAVAAAPSTPPRPKGVRWGNETGEAPLTYVKGITPVKNSPRSLQNRALTQRVRRGWERDPRRAPAENRKYFQSEPFEYDPVNAEFVAMLRARELSEGLRLENELAAEAELADLQAKYNNAYWINASNRAMWYNATRKNLNKMRKLNKTVKNHPANPYWAKLNFLPKLASGGKRKTRRQRK